MKKEYLYAKKAEGWMEHITELIEGVPIRYYIYETKRWYPYKSHHELADHAVKMSEGEFMLEML